jgi:hypothetical protein
MKRDAFGKLFVPGEMRGWTLAVALAGLLPACGGDKPPGSGTTSNPSAGAVAFALTVPNGVELDTVGYQLTNGAGVPMQTGEISVKDSQSIQFQLGNVPPGSGYTVSTTASGPSGVMCSGSAGPFSVAPRATTNVKIGMACYAKGSDAGNVFVTGEPYLCGTWNSLATVGPDNQGTNGSEVNVGGTITLVATATGPDPKGLTYTWTSSNPIGSFGPNDPNGTSDTTTFVCSVPGTTTITLVVGDGSVPAGDTCDLAQSTVTAVVTCDAPPQTFDHVAFNITTGSAPLELQASASVTLLPQSGPAQTFLVKPAGDPAWKANTTHTASFALKPSLGSCDVTNAVVTFNPGGSNDPAQGPVPSGLWEVTRLQAVLSINNADQTTIIDASGSFTPLADLTTTAPTFTQPAVCPTGPSLFARLGGQPGMTVVANDFVTRVTSDQRLTGLFGTTLATPASQAAAASWLVSEMCLLSGGGCSLPGASPFTGAATTDQALALIQDLTASIGGFPTPAAIADENELLGSALIVDQTPLVLPHLPHAPPDPQAAVGSPIAAPSYYNLYWDATWDADNGEFTREALDSLTTALTASSYYAGLSEYGVGQPAFLGSSVPNSACTQKSPTSVGFYDPVNASIIGFLNCELSNDSSVPQSDSTIYNVILPSGSLEADAIAQLVGVPGDCVGGAVSWHFHGTPYNIGSFIGGLIGGALGLGAGSPELGAVAGFLIGLTTQGGPFYTISSADSRCGTYTNNLMHELVEAATDSKPGLDVILSGGTGEIADLCHGSSPSWVASDGTISGGFLSDSIPQYWSNAGQFCEAGFSNTTAPSISGVSFSGNPFPALSLTISGSGFGTLPPAFPIPSSSLLPYIGVQDSAQGWQAGNSLNSDTVGMSVLGWSDTSITIGNFSPSSPSTSLNDGDHLDIWVCNPASGKCTSRIATAPNGTGGGGPNPNDIVSIAVSFSTGGDDARSDTELQLRVDSDPAVCLKPSNNASADSVCPTNGGSATDQNGLQSWNNNSSDGTQHFTVITPAPILDHMDVTLISHNHGESDDNWDIQSVKVVGTQRSGALLTLLDLNSTGDCIARLKASPNASTVRFSLNTSGTHVYVGGTSTEMNEVTTCSNNGG